MCRILNILIMASLFQLRLPYIYPCFTWLLIHYNVMRVRTKKTQYRVTWAWTQVVRWKFFNMHITITKKNLKYFSRAYIFTNTFVNLFINTFVSSSIRSLASLFTNMFVKLTNTRIQTWSWTVCEDSSLTQLSCRAHLQLFEFASFSRQSSFERIFLESRFFSCSWIAWLV